MSRALVAAAVAAAVVVPTPASAADVFVGSSTSGADDTGPCTSAGAPCETIQAAVDKSEATGGGEVRVIPNPDGRTTDAYDETVLLDSSAPVNLVGAGRRANGTLVAPSSGTPLTLATATTARSLRVAASTGGTAIDAAVGSTVDEVFAEATGDGGIAYDGAGRLEDSRLIGRTGARLDAARLVRTEVVSTRDGIVARLGTSRLLQVIVRAPVNSGRSPGGRGPQRGHRRGSRSRRDATREPDRLRRPAPTRRAGTRCHAVPGTTSYTVDACNRVYTTQLVPQNAPAGTVRRLTTTGQCFPPPAACTVLGTEGNDTLTGTAGRDVICGRGGNDKLFGLEGDDLLSGGAGNDTFVGGPGDDVIQGGDGSDFADYTASTQPVAVTIGSGADDGVAGEADDVQADVERVNGGSADDALTAGSRRARLVGLGGADVLRGGGANDTLDGREGADELEGGEGRDMLLGGDDADVHLALDGRQDRLVCGAGVDTRVADPIDVIDASCE